MKHYCMICGTEDPNEFTVHEHSLLCDDCRGILNYWYKEALEDMKTHYRVRNGSEMYESEFLQGLEEFTQIKIGEYNEELRRERLRNKAKAHGVGTSP